MALAKWPVSCLRPWVLNCHTGAAWHELGVTVNRVSGASLKMGPMPEGL